MVLLRTPRGGPPWAPSIAPARGLRLLSCLLIVGSLGCTPATTPAPASSGTTPAATESGDAVAVEEAAPAPDGAGLLAAEDEALRSACPAEAAARFLDQDVAATLNALHDRMYTIGETSGRLADWEAVIACAAVHIVDRMGDPERHGELLANVTPEATPLTFAAVNGYPAVVRVLLRFAPVVEHLEDPGPYELTPWQLANLAPNLTMLAINPTVVSSPFRLVPYLVKTTYYGDDTIRPYHAVRDHLAGAGAATDIEPVRAFILTMDVCSDPVKERVRNADDVLSTLRDIVLTDPDHGLPSLQRG